MPDKGHTSSWEAAINAARSLVARVSHLEWLLERASSEEAEGEPKSKKAKDEEERGKAKCAPLLPTLVMMLGNGGDDFLGGLVQATAGISPWW